MYKVVLEKDASFWSGAKAVGSTAMKGLNMIGNAAFPLMMVGSMITPLFQKPPKEAPRQTQDPDRYPGNMKFASEGGAVKVAFTLSGIVDRVKGALGGKTPAEDVPKQYVVFDSLGKEVAVSKNLPGDRTKGPKKGHIRYDTDWGVIDVPEPFAKKRGIGSKSQLGGKKLPGNISEKLRAMEDSGQVINYTKKYKAGDIKVIKPESGAKKVSSSPKLLKARIPVKTIIQKVPPAEAAVAAGAVASSAGAAGKAPATGASLGNMWKSTPAGIKGALVGAGAIGLASLLAKKKKEEPAEKNMFKIGAYSVTESGEYEAYVHPLLTKEALFGWLKKKPNTSYGGNETKTVSVKDFGGVDADAPSKKFNYKKEPEIPEPTVPAQKTPEPTGPDKGKTPGMKENLKNTWASLPRWGKGMALVGAGVAAGALINRLRKDDAPEERSMFRLG